MNPVFHPAVDIYSFVEPMGKIVNEETVYVTTARWIPKNIYSPGTMTSDP